MNQQKPPKKSGNNYKNLAILTGIAFEMGAIIFLAAKGGKWLDSYFDPSRKMYTVISTLLGVALAIWVVLRHLKHIRY